MLCNSYKIYEMSERRGGTNKKSFLPLLTAGEENKAGRFVFTIYIIYLYININIY